MSTRFHASPSPAGYDGADGVLSVSQLARRARILIEEHLGSVIVEGELSNFRQPASGHWYFTLKDQAAQIRCAMFAGRNRMVRLAVGDGLQVRVSGRVSLYEPRGDFQLIVEHLEAAGEGALRAAFDALKAKLAGEGLFDEERKRMLPAYPRHLTIISSTSGAALRDVLHVLERRFPSLEVLLIPSAVQGDAAEAQLLRALEQAAGLSTDVVLLTRGGGSLEDLWAFNLESVTRAVAASPHPVVSAIGHQTDFAMTDFAADLRAPTPSAAAELITPTGTELAAAVRGMEQRLLRTFGSELRLLSTRLDHLGARLVDPATQVASKMQQVDELDARLRRAWSAARNRNHAGLTAVARALALLAPDRQLREQRYVVGNHQERLTAGFKQRLNRSALALAGGARALSAVSPLNTLQRGYAVLTREAPPGARYATVSSVTHTAPGERLRALLADGSLGLEVLNVTDEPPLSTPQIEETR